MKEVSIENLNKVFDNRVRVGIMSALSVNESLNFNELKQILGLTDGNLANHLKALEDNQYISVEKGFIGRKTNTVYSLTPDGAAAFAAHIKALQTLIGGLSD